MYVYVVLCTCASTGLLTQLIKMLLRKVAMTHDELHIHMNGWKMMEVAVKIFCRVYIIIATTVATLFCLTIPVDAFITYIYLFFITIGIILLILPSVISLAVVMLRWCEETAVNVLPSTCDFSHLQEANEEANEVKQIEVGLEPWPVADGTAKDTNEYSIEFSPKLRVARSRLYRSQFFQVNMRLKALAEI